MESLHKFLEQMSLKEALAAITEAINMLFQHADEKDRLDFAMSLMGDAGKDKIASMVNLWLAECMDEGVDPTHMCQSLVHKVAQSKQLMAVTDPDILVLFEDWLEELEEEAVNCIKKRGRVDAGHIAQDLGLSERGASFLLTKLKREDKI